MLDELTRTGGAGFPDLVDISPDEALDVIAGRRTYDSNMWRRSDYVRELGMWDFFNDMPEAAINEICQVIAADRGTSMPKAYKHLQHLITEITNE